MKLNRREFVTAATVAVVGGVLREVPVFGQAAAAGEFGMVRRNVGTYVGRGGTIGWLISPDAFVVVDTQYADSAETFLRDSKGRTTRRIDLVVNSHHHPDHTSGNVVLRPAATRIVAHRNSAEWQKKRAVAGGTDDKQAYPDITFTDTWKQDVGDEVVALKYYGAGHTGGDIATHFVKANVVHLGDLMSNYRHPRVDLESGASVKHWGPALDAVMKDHDADTIYIYGHNKDGVPVTGGRQDLVVMRDYFNGTLDFVQKQIAAGKSIDEVAKVTAVPGFPQHAGDLSYLLRSTYEELSKKA